MDIDRLQKDIDDFWDAESVPTLTEYIKIPNKPPAFDPDWQQNGHMEKVLNMAHQWIENFDHQIAQFTSKRGATEPR